MHQVQEPESEYSESRKRQQLKSMSSAQCKVRRNLPDGSSIRRLVVVFVSFHSFSRSISFHPFSYSSAKLGKYLSRTTVVSWPRNDLPRMGYNIMQKAESKRETHPGDMQIERPRLGRERDRDSEQDQTRWTRGKQGQEASGIDSSLSTWEQHRQFLEAGNIILPPFKLHGTCYSHSSWAVCCPVLS